MGSWSIRVVLARMLFLALALACEGARADEPGVPLTSLTSQQMAAIMHTYVRGEQQASIPFAISGAVTVTGGALLLTSESPLRRGAAWPLLGVGAIELISGVVLGAASGPHEASLSALLARDPKAFLRVERPHLNRIQNVFQPLLLSFEGALVAAGAGMAGVGGLRRQETLEGVGIGLAVQGLVMFLLDWDVLDRARAYTTGLDQFRP